MRVRSSRAGEVNSMSTELAQVTFRLGESMEIRYLGEPPRRGDRVDSHDGQRYLVSDVVREGALYEIGCVPLVQPKERVWDVVAADLAAVRRRALAPPRPRRVRSRRVLARGRRT
jgi:hypothetical protein